MCVSVGGLGRPIYVSHVVHSYYASLHVYTMYVCMHVCMYVCMSNSNFSFAANSYPTCCPIHPS